MYENEVTALVQWQCRENVSEPTFFFFCHFPGLCWLKGLKFFMHQGPLLLSSMQFVAMSSITVSTT